MSSDSAAGPGIIAGRYRIDSLIGRGGMASVFRAFDTRLDRVVAVKLLNSDLASQPTFRKRFRREAQAAARMNHPGIVRVFDAGEETVTDEHGEHVRPFMVMELVEGDLLSTRLSRGRPSTDEAIKLILQLLEALEYSHTAGVVHRDIKPGNLILTREGVLKVMDFGIARALTDENESVSQTTTILGTAAYFSPEQARGETVDERSDLYSAGVVLFEMLTGRTPFQGETPVAVAYQHISEAPVAPSSINPAVTPSLDAVVARALAKKKSERYESAEQFAEDVRAAAEGRELTDTSPSATTLLLQNFDASELSVEEMTLKQIAESATAVRTQRRVPLGWIWAGIGGTIALITLLIVWAAFINANIRSNENQRTVPALAGMTESQAIAEIEELDLKVKVVEESSDSVSTGRVISSEPGEGRIVTIGTTVTIKVSTGNATISVPDLRNMTIEEARAALEDLDLKVGTENRVDDANIPEERVISSKPEARTKVEPGTTINLLLSTGEVTVPNVLGKPLSEATSLLGGAQYGLVVMPEGDQSCATAENQPVTFQSIVGTTAQHSEIVLRYCSGPAAG